ncbi:hypothetical protein BBJ29_005472 [Phytophthora kernoviae]|uniref:Uncharacterized protein n=1 Tax=Phytophthora kernoviae TaxID=325452 RepID=A0A3F2RM96_9STRA|nr:hypothetical protein BBP00_00006738 [Phytophthora kernoviae]RLN59740.1 hypothetical protein BBJ29_005472 [Phytophthora kernoviae]
MACLAHRAATDDKQLLGGVVAYSSADRPSESPVNTLTSSRCWMELHEQRATDVEQGERVQYSCGCSTGHSCYWSSSASTDQNATEFIDYELNGPCVVTAVQIVPYRVFWHPDSPTYAPKRVLFEFFDAEDKLALQQRARGLQTRTVSVSPRPSSINPFYTSPVYDVKNDMMLQEFTLSRKLALRERMRSAVEARCGQSAERCGR